MRPYRGHVTSVYLDAERPLAFAHRGGALLEANRGIENTLESFANAVELGFRFLETDVQASRDGMAHVFHDLDCARLLGRPGAFGSLSAEEIAACAVGGRCRVPTLRELLDSFPDVRFNIDLKHEAVVAPAIEAVRDAGATDRVLFASFHHRTLVRARQMAPEIATSASPLEVGLIKSGATNRTRALGRRGRAVALQVPIRRGKIRIVTEGFIGRAHRLGMQVHVWTVDNVTEMNALLDLGVDGLMSDRVDVLKDVLVERGAWKH